MLVLLCTTATTGKQMAREPLEIRIEESTDGVGRCAAAGSLRACDTMWTDLLWLLCVGWTVLATAAVLRADTIRHTAKLALHATLRSPAHSDRAASTSSELSSAMAARCGLSLCLCLLLVHSPLFVSACQLWTRPAVLEEEEEAEEDGGAEGGSAAAQAEAEEAQEAPPPAPAPSPYAASQVRVWRYVVTPRRTTPAPHTTTNQHRRPPLHSHPTHAAASSSSAAVARPAALDFAVELQWQAPPAVLEGERVPITYELRLQPEESASGSGAGGAEPQPSSDATPQREETQESKASAAQAPLIHRFTMSAPAVAAEPATTTAAMDLDGEPAEEEGDSGGSGCGSGDNSASEVKDNEEMKRMHRLPRKRKVASRSSSRAAPIVGGAGAKRNNRTRSGGAEAAAAAVALSFDEDDDDEGGADAALAAASSSAVAAAPASADAADSSMRGTFEEPRFLLEHPSGSSEYTVRVLASAGSYGAAAASAPRPSHADCLSLPVQLSFAPLPRLLYLVQSLPASGSGSGSVSAGRARKVLDAFDRLVQSLTPRDVLQGIDWATPLLHILKANNHNHSHNHSANSKNNNSNNSGNNHNRLHRNNRIHKRACNVLGKLVDWKRILIDLCSHAALVRAMRQLVDDRLHSLAQRTHQARAKKRARKGDCTNNNNASASGAPAKAAEPPSSESAQPQPPQSQSQPPTPVASEDESGLGELLVPDELPAAAPAENEGDTDDLDDDHGDNDNDEDDEESVAAAAAPDAAPATAAATATDADADATAVPALKDPILENILWFALAAVRLHDDQPCAPCSTSSGNSVSADPSTSASSPSLTSSSSASSPSPSLVALRSFVAAGGHLLLFSLAQQCGKAEWFGQYQPDALTALANMCGQPPSQPSQPTIALSRPARGVDTSLRFRR